MIFDRTLTQKKLLDNLLIVFAFAHKLQHLNLALAQPIEITV